ncbi:uncharacterized protein PAC_02498 [Phialocephala subalpina]|uniref:Heterokaryon incompatibility domain-containing protein n=1 Tax=Phialocephala subalpina TaxID=576137 RepID=A0A1L7WIM6_9HELO|nr:uncharacterized protein PAC_02498 [Phialocephala subalpina]
MDNKLCVTCDYKTRDIFYPHHRKYTFPDLASYNEISKSGGSCPLCALVRTGLRRAFLQRNCGSNEAASVDAEICSLYTTVTTKNHYYDWGLSYPETVYRREMVRMTLQNKRFREMLVVELGKMCCRYTIKRLPTLGTPDHWANNLQSDTTFLDVKTWFQDNIKGRTPTCLPKRVLDLGNGEDESLTANIRLLDDTSHINEKYVALSHRWSSQPHIQLTKETYREYLENIPFANLPLLFKDAAKFCRQMGVRYLWIDALCIIQKDEEDWRAEASRMGRIYKDADCVIMPHFAKGDSEGFLEEAFSEQERILIKSTGPDATELEILVKPVTAAKKTIDESPLSKRGWVFQERLLATRVVHFAPRNVMMEVMGDLRGSVDEEIPQRKLKRLLLGQEEASPRQFLQLWATLVQSYSECELTNDKDKLPAISGLAKILHSSRVDQYFLSGLWSMNLWEQLLWISTSDSATRLEWRAPSWSWASLNTTVRFLQLDEFAQNNGLFVDGFSSSYLDEKTAWVDGPCVLAIRGSVIEWDDNKLVDRSTDDAHVCIKQNSELGDLVEGMGREIQPLWSAVVPGDVNGWVSLDVKQRRKRWKAAWPKTWNFQRFKRLGLFRDNDGHSKCAPLTTGPQEIDRKWISLTTGEQEWESKTSDRALPREICVQVCSYVPYPSKNREKRNHIFLVLQRVENTGDYKRIGVGEVFLEDIFSQVRGKHSEGKKFKFLGHKKTITIV